MYGRYVSTVLAAKLRKPYVQRAFLEDQAGRARRGYVICRCPRPQQLDAQITALPWSHL